MNPTVKCTHVIPSHLPPVRDARLSTLLVCRFCMTTIGGYATLDERLMLEKKHVCQEQLSIGKPAASVPFN